MFHEKKKKLYFAHNKHIYTQKNRSMIAIGWLFVSDWRINLYYLMKYTPNSKLSRITCVCVSSLHINWSLILHRKEIRLYKYTMCQGRRWSSSRSPPWPTMLSENTRVALTRRSSSSFSSHRRGIGFLSWQTKNRAPRSEWEIAGVGKRKKASGGRSRWGVSGTSKLD